MRSSIFDFWTGDCDSYAYYKDKVITGKDLGGTYRPTTQLQWSAHNYEPHAMPKMWNWSHDSITSD